MTVDIFNMLMEQGFNIALLCVAVFYMHKKVEKGESKNEELVKQLMQLTTDYLRSLDALTDEIKELRQKLD